MARYRHLLLALVASIPNSVFGQWCPPLGPALQVPTKLAAHPLIREAVANITAQLDTIWYGGGRGSSRSQRNLTYSSIGALSIYDDEPLLEHHHMPAGGPSGVVGNSTTQLTGDSVYRIASISKVFTVLVLLLNEGKVSFEDPVTKFVPELAAAAASASAADEGVEVTDWREITVGALASHLAGIGRTYSLGDLSISSNATALRSWLLPPLNGTDLPRCGAAPSQPPCSREEYLAGIIRRHPVFPPFATPSYSNAAFAILGFVIEAVTNKTYEAALEESVLKPLNLTRTSVRVPADSDGNNVILDTARWRWDLDVENPTAGLYSSLYDQLKLGRGILRSDLLRPARTRRWLKPWTHTGALDASVGAPWEIARSTTLTPDRRVVDQYTKSGAIGAYRSFLVLVPDYGLVVSVLLALPSPSTEYRSLAQIVLATLVPAADAVAREQAAAAYAGLYVSRDSDDASAATSAFRVIVDRGPGLRVSEVRVRSQNATAIFAGLLAGVSSDLGESLSIRLYPSGLVSGRSTSSSSNSSSSSSNSSSSLSPSPSRVSFRAFAGRDVARGASAADDPGSACGFTWSGIDAYVYAQNAIDDVLFHIGADGRAARVESRAWRLALDRASPPSSADP